MAKQSGNICITGTTEHLCFYKMDGKYYVRLKSSLTRKRVMLDPAFSKTQYYAQLLGKAAKLSSTVYKTLLPENKKKGLYKTLTGIAIVLLKAGKTDDSIISILYEHVTPQPFKVIEDVQLVKHSKSILRKNNNGRLKMLFIMPKGYLRRKASRSIVSEDLRHSGFVQEPAIPLKVISYGFKKDSDNSAGSIGNEGNCSCWVAVFVPDITDVK